MKKLVIEIVFDGVKAVGTVAVDDKIVGQHTEEMAPADFEEFIQEAVESIKK